MSSDAADLQAKIQDLEKENRTLQKKLERAKATCLQLEETNQKKESLLRQVICELKESQIILEQQSQELGQTLTNLKQTQTQLIQTEKMSSLGQLVAGVAHEINNPINFIHGNLTHVQDYAHDLLRFIEIYQRYTPQIVAEIEAETDLTDLAFLQEDLPKLLSSMKTGTNRIRAIVLSLRNFSRLDEAEFKLVDIHEGIDSTLLILQHRLKDELENPIIEVIRDYGNLPLIECYPGQLNQVFMNIVNNAIDALQEFNAKRSSQEIQDNPSQITIKTSVLDSHLDSQWVQVAIADNGPGIPEELCSSIFNLFFTTKSVGKSTGVSMSISYQIITEKHGGRLTCSSKFGKGAEFVIQIPIHQTL